MSRNVQHVRVPISEFSDERLDTGFYSQAYFVTRDQIEKSGLSTETIGSICEPWQFGAYALCNEIEWADSETGVPYIKAEALGSPLLNESGLAYVTPRTHRLLEKSRLLPGDIVVSTSGTIGLCAVLPEHINTANSNQDTIKFNPSAAGYDCYFVSAWLSSAPAQVFLNREAGGAVQQHVYLFNFKRLPLLKLSPTAQRYIGDKVRQAERLRERARDILQSVRRHHETLIPDFRPSSSKWNSFRVNQKLMADVIVPHFYPPTVAEYLQGRPNESLINLCLSIYSGTTYAAKEDGVDQTTSRTCTGQFPRQPFNRVISPSRTDLDLAPHDLILTNAAHDKAYIGKDVTYFHGGPRNIPSAKVMVIRADRSRVPASYLFTYLQMPVGYVQIQSAIRGISAGIRGQDIGGIRIPIPVLSDSDKEEWLSKDRLMLVAGTAQELASHLCASATALVEALIAGEISEQDLTSAQQALESGNRDLDRAILKSLRRAEDATQPLIPDIEALYALLDDLDQEPVE